jgi:capsid portal protein
MASVLQKDELFQEYIENNRQRVQSAFNLPDLYVGYTRDFNRATAQTAMEVTEKQVFQPERRSLAWIINNRLLNGYNLKYCEVEFRSPDITNPDDLYKILTVCEKAGGLPPNKAKQIAYSAIGESSDDYPEEWGDIPLSVSNQQNLVSDLDGQIKKAQQNNESEEVVAVLKEVRRLLTVIKKQGDENEKANSES